VRRDEALRSLADPDEIPRTASGLLGEHLQVHRCVYCTFASDEDPFDLTSVSLRPEVPSMAGRYTLLRERGTDLFDAP
jgi:hypothetical protein